MKRVPELRDLSDDHHTGLLLARRCKQLGDRERDPSTEAFWDLIEEAFVLHLAPHFEIEERLLVPALEALGEASLAERIRADHAALRALHEAKAPRLASIVEFGERLEAHIRFEERHVFEPTQDRLPANVLEAIAAACEATPRACPAFLRP